MKLASRALRPDIVAVCLHGLPNHIHIYMDWAVVRDLGRLKSLQNGMCSSGITIVIGSIKDMNYRHDG
jgi:hypothetical protein